MNEAAFYYLEPGGAAHCLLCPRGCRIPSGGRGFCGVRRHVDGILVADSYARPVALQVDPIEKKPLAHFLPGTKTFSLGTFGCNLACPWCQNDGLSRGDYDPGAAYETVTPERIVALAKQYGCRSVAFTYNEPTVFFEYARDIAGLARAAGLATVLVSNGYISRDAARELYGLMDAANIDMKGFDAGFYRAQTGGELSDVLAAMELFYGDGRHLELTNLVIPGLNDAPEMIADYLDWVATHLACSVPLHFSAYHPCYHCQRPPTPASTLERIRRQALERGFSAVHLGNIR